MSDDQMSDAFLEHRRLLFTGAYEMLGGVADAEDVLQDSWLRWSDVDLSTVRDPRAYLVRLVTRQALNRMRTVKRRREAYVGPWLPEPLATTPDVAEDVELADSVSFAMLVVLETLTPLERAVFVLRDVFSFEYDEIATATERSADAVRQVASRARKHVQARRPRVDATPDGATDAAQVAQRFLDAAVTGDLQALLAVLAPEVVLTSDGGGVIRAALRPIVGADKVARFLSGIRPAGPVVEAGWTQVNGAPAVRLTLDGALDSVVSVDVRDGLVQEIFFVRNPDKLGHLDDPVLLSRR